ncbi:replication protein A 14 kDa subunit A [Dendroctonus ponderosae]|uniref:Replication protein A 14 kDa subunit n=1 Tax=Dendroctonus ponderosae TaxID=77166 RepID=U4U9E1_DENPD|nr:replication protein A 14 kDa subunit A [Dendroctonus ponderosae]ERL86555.1 hypothetical protein D910_03962 [Dendroctonus ponderosae]KAH1003318.1 hypothetical protein HUJ05_011246 [Dendroctonus ponderosae]
MDNVRDIVNGAQLPRFLGKNVSIIGKAGGADPGAASFTIVTTDNVQVQVIPNEPPTQPVSGWVEVRGECTSRNSIKALDYVIFANEKFDAKGYNELCSLLYAVPDIWSTEGAPQ